MDRVKKNIPLITLTGIFIIGNAVINLPFSQYPQGVILGFILSVTSGFFFILLSERSFKTQNDKKLPKTIFTLYCLLSAIVTVRNFITFSDRVLLPEMKGLLPSLLFLVLLYFLCKSGKKVILKISVISAVLILISTILLLFLSLENIKLNSFFNVRLSDIKGIFYEATAFLSLSFMQIVILMYFLKEEKAKNSIKTGYFLGVAVLLICFIQSIGVLGVSLTGRLLNPYAQSVSIISFGDRLSRMEGFSYFLYFSASLIKAGVCLLAGKRCIASLNKKAEGLYLMLSLIIIAVFCVFTSFFKDISFIYIAPFLAVPPIYFIFTLKLHQ
ncbi:MAG: GerAB/ArcD/ProY family transporter [Acutalibacteraceae bacterium]|nr:GerAB/ArcD/ProY family transporter [Acutalibacteraceae bacterium]